MFSKETAKTAEGNLPVNEKQNWWHFPCQEKSTFGSSSRLSKAGGRLPDKGDHDGQPATTTG
jgi:hypothetical protein